MGNRLFHGVSPAVCLPAGRPERCRDQPVVRTPFALPPDPHPPIRESPDRDSCHPVRARGRRSWHGCGDQGIPWRWQDTETGPGLKSRHGNSHHLNRGKCRKGRPCRPDLGGFWVRCCGYARPLPPREKNRTYNRDRGRDRDDIQGATWRSGACRRSPLHPGLRIRCHYSGIPCIGDRLCDLRVLRRIRTHLFARSDLVDSRADPLLPHARGAVCGVRTPLYFCLLREPRLVCCPVQTV